MARGVPGIAIGTVVSALVAVLLRLKCDLPISIIASGFGAMVEGISRLAPEKKSQFHLGDPIQVENSVSQNAIALDKSKPGRQLRWYSALRGGLFLGGLAGRWDDVARVCSWFDASIEPEFSSGTIEDHRAKRVNRWGRARRRERDSPREEHVANPCESCG